MKKNKGISPSAKKQASPAKKPNVQAREVKSKNNSQAGANKKSEEVLPGYPHYPSEEDIMSKSSGMKKVESNFFSIT